VRVVRDAVRREARGPAPSLASQQAEAAAEQAAPVAYRRYVPPQSVEPIGDAVQADYNDYLARLHDVARGSAHESAGDNGDKGVRR